MSNNYLMLNKLKTAFLQLCFNRSGTNGLTEIRVRNNVAVALSLSLKTVSVIFGHTLAMDEHINKVIGVCYANSHNLGRIGSKLPCKLKTQLVHSIILSHLDYCNSLLAHFTFTD